jgi:MFS transporter, PPP family, 3-phenylpropionic acid transporter
VPRALTAITSSFANLARRNTASAAFVIGTLVAGQLLTSMPISTLVWIDAFLLLGAAAATPLLPQPSFGVANEPGAASSLWAGVVELLRAPAYRGVVTIAALVYGSHAIHDSFAVIRWSDAGIGPFVISVLWSEAVVAEVAVFFFIGPRLISLVGTNASAALSAGLGLLRWSVEGATTSVAALAIIQPLHGVTFALLHLVCIRVIAAVVPTNLAATGQSFYALGSGLATSLLTLFSRVLFAKFGGASFFAMAALCALALPLAWLKVPQ